MEDKEKQIEEMAKLIDDRLIEARGYLGSMNKGEGYWIAQKLIEHYQPKLPKDSVVLSKEEYEYLKAKSTRIPIDKDGNFIEYAVYDTDRVLSKPEYRDYIYGKGSKETAEKILTFLDDNCDCDSEYLARQTKEYIAEQFDVKIKE